MHPLQYFPTEELPSFADVRSPTDTDPGAFNFWNVESIGDPARDLARGEALASEAIAYSQRHQCPAAIAFALNAIIERGETGWLETGFICRIARAAHVAAQN